MPGGREAEHSSSSSWDILVESLEAVTLEGKRVVIAGVRMMCQSVKTVQHLEKGVTSVTRKTIS